MAGDAGDGRLLETRRGRLLAGTAAPNGGPPRRERGVPRADAGPRHGLRLGRARAGIDDGAIVMRLAIPRLAIGRGAVHEVTDPADAHGDQATARGPGPVRTESRRDRAIDVEATRPFARPVRGRGREERRILVRPGVEGPRRRTRAATDAEEPQADDDESLDHGSRAARPIGPPPLGKGSPPPPRSAASPVAG